MAIGIYSPSLALHLAVAPLASI
ncbi:hypothetical protein BCAR13_90056 [Paraburkholderia caribensis]|nr:hypothetical protein BCAR13_90056 [Paraburkholderia caribensis]